MWLLSRGRTEEAKQTLKKLRGGASEERCTKEFQDMVHYTSKTDLNEFQTGNRIINYYRFYEEYLRNNYYHNTYRRNENRQVRCEKIVSLSNRARNAEAFANARDNNILYRPVVRRTVHSVSDVRVRHFRDARPSGLGHGQSENHLHPLA